MPDEDEFWPMVVEGNLFLKVVSMVVILLVRVFGLSAAVAGFTAAPG